MRSCRQFLLLATWSVFFSFVCLGNDAGEAKRIHDARQHFQQAGIFKPPAIPAQATLDDTWRQIDSRRDPQTSFESFIYGIARHQAKLLTTPQSVRWDQMIEDHAAIKSRLHDERNTIRSKTLIGEWMLGTLHDAETIRHTEQQLDGWLDLHLDYVFQEWMAHQRFRRDAWELLSRDQRAHVLSGDWDQYVRKSIGHLRKYSADKIVRRALGPPEHESAVAALVQQQQTAHAPIHDDYTRAATRLRKLTFAMDLNSEALLAAEWPRYKSAFRSFLLAQRRDVPALIRAGYDTESAKNQAAINSARRLLRDKVFEKFRPHAQDLVSLIYGNQVAP
ncbi:MAG: hypothetical protein AB8B91_09145 [Rubripirellula sp.]